MTLLRTAIRAIVLVALMGLLISAAPSGAAEPPPQVVDAQGDANFLNDHSEAWIRDAPSPPGVATPVGSMADFDIVSLRWSTVFTKAGKKVVPSAVAISMTTAAPIHSAGNFGVYSVQSKVSGTCLFGLNYQTFPDKDPVAGGFICNSKATYTVVDILTDVRVSGNTITWTVKLRNLLPPSLPQIKIGDVVTHLGGYTIYRVSAGGQSNANSQPDEAFSSGTYTRGR